MLSVSGFIDSAVLFVGQIFKQAPFVSLYIQLLTYNLNQNRYDHRLCRNIRMEAVFDRDFVLDVRLALLTSIQVVVNILYLIQNEFRLITTFKNTFFVLGLKRVGLYDKKSIVVVLGYLSSLPCQQVHINMTIPLCNDIRFSTFHHPISVEDNDDRPV